MHDTADGRVPAKDEIPPRSRSDSLRFLGALIYAATPHAAQARKGTDAPYVSRELDGVVSELERPTLVMMEEARVER